ncbi:MAG: methylase [Thermoplasmata archaeon]|nr:MAG: methylase [Thermoplasmata archaeon]
MGTGSGILAIISAKKGARVVAIDINGEATKCAKMNAKNHGVDIEVICSDLFSCFKEQRIFDLIIFNIPYLNIKPRDTFDLSICDYRKEMLRRFLDESHKYLKDDGKILMTYSSVSDINETERIFGEKGWHFEKILERDISEFESIVVYKLKKAKV